MAPASEYWNRFWSKRLSRRRLLQTSALTAAGIAAAGVVGCGDDEGGGGEETASPTPVASPKAGGTFRGPLVGLSTGNPPSLDSQRQLTFLAQIPAAYHYSRLLKFAPGATAEVDGVTSVLIDFSNVEGDACDAAPEVLDEGTTFNFKLRDNLNFHNIAPVNGRAVTAEDVKHSIDIFAAESPNRGNWLAQVDSVTVTGEKTFQIKLKNPFAPALQVLFANNDGGPWVIPAELLDNKDQVSKTPIGSGPWIFESWEPSVAIKWKKNPDYYDAPLPYIENWEAVLTGDPEQILANLKAGQFDGSLWSADLWSRGRSELPDGQWFTGPEHVWGGAYFNYANPPFNDVRVRQALSMSIDRPGIQTSLDGPGAVGGGSGLTHVSQYDRFWIDAVNDESTFGPNSKYFKYDIAEAKALLSAAGFETIDITANSSNVYGAGFGRQMDAVAASAREAGINMTINLGEYAGYISTTFLGDIPANQIGLAPLIGSPIDPHNIFFTVFHPSSGRHNWGPKGAVPPADLPKANDNTPAGDAELLGLWTSQAQELDEEARVELVRDVQRSMAESMWLVPWPGVSTAYVYQPHVKNIRLIRGYGFGVETAVHMWLDKA